MHPQPGSWLIGVVVPAAFIGFGLVWFFFADRMIDWQIRMLQSPFNRTRQPGFDFHPLHGRPQRYTIHVNGPWCLTFEWEEGTALRVDLEQYH